MQEHQDEWLTVEEAAALLGVSERTIQRREKEGKVAADWRKAPPARNKPNRVYSKSDLLRLLNQSPDDKV